MSPAVWKSKRLRDLAAINYGKSPAGILASDGAYPVVGTGGTERLGNEYLYNGDSIILGRKGTIDRVHFATGRFWTIDTAYFLSGFNEALPQWLYYFLQDIDLRQLNEATGVPSLSRDVLYKIEIPTPPKPEQTKIAEVLSTVDRAIGQTEALIAKQQRIKTGLMQDLLTRGIDEHGNPRSEDTHAFKDSPLGRIPVEWELRRLGEVLDGVIDFRGKTPRKLGMTWGGGEIPALSANNVKMGWIDFDKETYYGSEKLYEVWMTKGDAFRGDIIITMEAPLGNVAQIPDDRKYILSQRVLLFKTRRDLIVNDCLKHQLASHKFQALLMENATGTTAKGIQQSRLMQLPVRISSLREQRRIAEILDAYDARIRVEEVYRRKLKLQKTALMQDFLTGEKRVTPLLDADDEQAGSAP